MKTIITIIIVVAVIAGIASLLFSSEGDPKERMKEAVGAAAGGAFAAGGCLLQLFFWGLGLLLALWVVALVFG